MTSNVGSDLIKRDSNLGFSVTSDEEQSHEDAYQRMKDKVLNELKKYSVKKIIVIDPNDLGTIKSIKNYKCRIIKQKKPNINFIQVNFIILI